MSQAKGKMLFNLLSASIYNILQPWISVGQHSHHRSELPVFHIWGYVLMPYDACFKKRKEHFLVVALYDHVVVIVLKYNSSCWTKLAWIAKATAHPPYGHSTPVVNLLIAFASPATCQISSAQLHTASPFLKVKCHSVNLKTPIYSLVPVHQGISTFILALSLIPFLSFSWSIYTFAFFQPSI